MKVEDSAAILASTWRSIAANLAHDVAWSLGIKDLHEQGALVDINKFFPPAQGS